MMIKNKVNKDLQIFWEMRDRAIDQEARKKAQEKIDEYLLGKPKKGRGKKKKEKKIRIQEDDWM